MSSPASPPSPAPPAAAFRAGPSAGHDEPDRTHGTPLKWFLRGVGHGFTLPGLVLFANYLGFGALLQGIGFPIGAGVLSTILIWALPAQVILAGGLAAGTALPALALAVGLSSIRFLPMVVAISPYMRGPRFSLKWELVCAHFVAMTLWIEGLRLLPRMPAEARLPFTLGLGHALIVISILGTVVGYYLSGEVPPILAAGLLLLTPLSFSAMLVRNAEKPTDWLALAAGFVLTPLTLHLEGGLDLMIAGVGGGTVAYLLGRRLERRR